MRDVTERVRDMLDKQEIVEVSYRYCRGVDRRDLELVKSVYHDDATDDHGIWKGRGVDFAQWIVDALPRETRTAHYVTNVTIELRGETAYSQAYCIALSEDGDQAVTVFNRYVDRFERRNGEWKIADRLIVFDLNRTLPQWHASDMGSGATWGARDRSDPSYRR